jgi:hypothetical protein
MLAFCQNKKQREKLMKMNLLSAVAIATFVFNAHVQADLIPESTEEIAACETVWAEQFRGTPHHEAALNHCNNMKGCMEHNSNNKDELDRCFYTAKMDFLAKTNKSQTPQEDTYTTSTPVVTNPAESDYSEISDDAKGWKYSQQE